MAAARRPAQRYLLAPPVPGGSGRAWARAAGGWRGGHNYWRAASRRGVPRRARRNLATRIEDTRTYAPASVHLGAGYLTAIARLRAGISVAHGEERFRAIDGTGRDFASSLRAE